MKNILLLTILLFTLCHCQTVDEYENRGDPVITDTIISMPGCERFKAEIKQWNLDHPNDQREADC